MTLDVTIVNVALSTLARDLDAGLDRIQWTVSAYSLAFGALLLPAGALSDRLGRRTVFTAGIATFTAASAACALAPNAAALVVARAVQGLGGSMAFAPALALIASVYEGAQRNAAIARFAAIASASGALGPLIGGALVHSLGWRWIFLINVPIGILTMIGSLARMPEPAAPDPSRRVDFLGAWLAFGALLALHYSLITGSDAGWTEPAVLVPALLGAALVAALIASQRRPGAMLDLDLLRIPAFSGAALLGFLARLTSLGVLAFLTLWLQGAHASSPLEVGLRLLPLTGSLLVVGLSVPRLQRRFATSHLVAGGFAAQGLGLVVLGLGSGAVQTTVGMILLGAGGAVIFPPLMGVAVGVAPLERAGMASGMTNACYPLGTAAGIALFGAVFSAHIRAALERVSGAELRAAVETGRLDLADATVRPMAQAAFDGAFTAVCLAAAVICLAGVLIARMLPRSLAEISQRSKQTTHHVRSKSTVDSDATPVPVHN
jgi:EmrB/QacA subfamily drug resistance transporter